MVGRSRVNSVAGPTGNCREMAFGAVNGATSKAVDTGWGRAYRATSARYVTTTLTPAKADKNR